MKERAEMLGGKMDVTTAPGDGTKIFVTLPISRSSENTMTSAIMARNEQ